MIVQHQFDRSRHEEGSNKSSSEDWYSSSSFEQIESFVHNLCNLNNVLISNNNNNNNNNNERREIVYTNPLSDAISRHDWHKSSRLIKNRPSLARATSSCDGMIPLHQACYEGAPLHIIQLLLSAYPQAAHTKCGEHNRLPIHYHLASSTTTTTTTTSPSEAIVSLLLEAFPESPRAGDAHNQYPIHLACQSQNVSHNIFALLLCSYPEGSVARDIHGNYPCDYATWNSDAKTKAIALSALVQNDATEMMRRSSSMGEEEVWCQPKIFDEEPQSARTQKRKRLVKEVSFSVFGSFDEIH